MQSFYPVDAMFGDDLTLALLVVQNINQLIDGQATGFLMGQAPSAGGAGAGEESEDAGPVGGFVTVPALEFGPELSTNPHIFQTANRDSSLSSSSAALASVILVSSTRMDRKPR